MQCNVRRHYFYLLVIFSLFTLQWNFFRSHPGVLDIASIHLPLKRSLSSLEYPSSDFAIKLSFLHFTSSVLTYNTFNCIKSLLLSLCYPFFHALYLSANIFESFVVKISANLQYLPASTMVLSFFLGFCNVACYTGKLLLS